MKIEHFSLRSPYGKVCGSKGVAGRTGQARRSWAAQGSQCPWPGAPRGHRLGPRPPMSPRGEPPHRLKTAPGRRPSVGARAGFRLPRASSVPFQNAAWPPPERAPPQATWRWRGRCWQSCRGGGDDARRAPRLRGTVSLRGDIPEPCPWLSQHAGQKGRPPHALGRYCRRQDHTRGRLLTGGHRSVHQSQTGARPLRSPVAVDPLPAPGGQGTAVWGVALGTRFIRLKADEHPLLRGVPSCRPGARGSGSRRGPSGGQSPHITPAAL